MAVIYIYNVYQLADTLLYQLMGTLFYQLVDMVLICVSCQIFVSVLETVDRSRYSSATIHETLG